MPEDPWSRAETMREWSTPIGAVIALGAGGALMVIAAATVPTDPAGRFLVGLAALALLVLAGLAARQRPRLAIVSNPQADGTHTGLAVTRLTGRHVYDRADVTRARIVRYPRLGRRVSMLEIDARDGWSGTERLLIFSRWDLGTNPEEVLEVLDAYGLAPREA